MVYLSKYFCFVIRFLFASPNQRYDRNTFKQMRTCECCSVGSYDEINVNLKCDDGFSIDVLISVPKMCSCQPCDGGSTKGKFVKTNSFQFPTD